MVESLTLTAADRDAGFNRCEYLRSMPVDHPDFPRGYGMRADTESFHAELEYAFHKQRLPAYGVHRQMLVLLGAALAQNAWALHVFHRKHDKQNAHRAPRPDRPRHTDSTEDRPPDLACAWVRLVPHRRPFRLRKRLRNAPVHSPESAKT